MLANTLAVVNCKKSKQNYMCGAAEMYSASPMFRAMIAFIEKYYPAYVILSAKYGVVTPDQVIEPYSLMIKATGYAKNNEANVLTKEQRVEWTQKVLEHPIWTQYKHIDFHLSKNYWELIAPHFTKQSNISLIPLPPNIGFVIRHYKWLVEDLEDGTPIDFTFRERPERAQSKKSTIKDKPLF